MKRLFVVVLTLLLAPFVGSVEAAPTVGATNPGALVLPQGRSVDVTVRGSGLGNLQPVLVATPASTSGVTAQLGKRSDQMLMVRLTATPAAPPSKDLQLMLEGQGVRLKALTFAVVPAGTVTLQGVTVTPSSAKSGSKATGQVMLTAAAPGSGALVTLRSDSPSLKVPPNVRVAAGATSAAFDFVLGPAPQTVRGLVTASYGGTSWNAAVTVEASAAQVGGTPGAPTAPPAPAAPAGPAPTLTSLSLASLSVVGGGVVTGTVTLTATAPTGGIAVPLSSNHPSATVPGSVTVLPGHTTANFSVTTSAVTAATVVTLSAGQGSAVRTAALSVEAPFRKPEVLSVTVGAPDVLAGGQVTGTVTLDQPAVSGGEGVTLQSSVSASATVPASVSVPAGQLTAVFQVSAPRNPYQLAVVPVTLTARLRASTKTVSFNVKPVEVLSFSPATPRQIMRPSGQMLLVMPGDVMNVKITPGANVAKAAWWPGAGANSGPTARAVQPDANGEFTVSIAYAGSAAFDLSYPVFLFDSQGQMVVGRFFGGFHWFAGSPKMTGLACTGLVALPGDFSHMAIPGRELVITGENLAPQGTVTNSAFPTVTVDGVSATILSVSPTQVKVTTPVVSDCFGVKVVQLHNGAGETGQSSIGNDRVSVPCVNVLELTPSEISLPSGSQPPPIVVRGPYLGLLVNPTVTINGVAGSVIFKDQNRIEVYFPKGITSGPVIVETPWRKSEPNGPRLNVFP